jgi:predicted CXXCH cytochrome family protein
MVKEPPTTERATLDAESSACMSCHDGAIARESSLAIESMHGVEGHPIGPQARMQPGSIHDEFQLANTASLDHRVRLFGQAVGCGSCHSVYAGGENLLVMSNMKSRLCLSCHID